LTGRPIRSSDATRGHRRSVPRTAAPGTASASCASGSCRSGGAA
jgi:hypothetical protein